jgi:hypothetical protein
MNATANERGEKWWFFQSCHRGPEAVFRAQLVSHQPDEPLPPRVVYVPITAEAEAE